MSKGSGVATISNRNVLGMRVDVTSYEDAVCRVVDWACEGRSSYVCVANVHMTMESYDSPEFQEIVSTADLVTPDGMPLVWALRVMGEKEATHVRGSDLMMHVMERAVKEDLPVGLYGGTTDSLEAFGRLLEERFPGARVACKISPPFRQLSPQEQADFARQISDSGTRILFVGIGCPKQERWMASHRGLLPAVMLGVGAAFDFHTGRVRQAPRWMQAAGLEWLFRLIMEPRRLWWRYAWHNPRFITLFAMQMLSIWCFGEDSKDKNKTAESSWRSGQG